MPSEFGLNRRLALTGLLTAPFAGLAWTGVAAAEVGAVAELTPEDQAFTTFLDQAFDETLALSPESLTSLGIKTQYDRLDDYTEAGADRALALAETQLSAMKARFSLAALGHQSQISWQLFERSVARQREGVRWRKHFYQATTNGSPAGDIPVFLINQHRVDGVGDAEAYIARLKDSQRVMTEVCDGLMAAAQAGIVAPAFTFGPVEADTRKILTGAPFTLGEDSALWADFRKKVSGLTAPEAEKSRLLAEGRAALLGPFKAGYEAFLATQKDLQRLARGNRGAWSLPDGDAYYAYRLRGSTTTDLKADQIHQTGLKELARIQGEMQAIMAAVGFKGSLQAFFKELKTNPRFQYPNSAEGRAAYLKDANGYIARVMTDAPRYFRRLPKAPLEVRAVETWRQDTASVAFYNRPAPDGSRPGIYYVNLADMTQVLKPQIEGISYHEGAPGHHFQIALAQELQGLPKFRRFGGYGAYSEGWGLYSERLGKEMGYYADPYSDFGRLSLEAWRAVRLVVDTGMHAKRWSREQAISFFRDNSLLSERDIVKEVERYISNPGQATSYMVGQLKIFELRARAQTALGEKYDIRDFHDAVLKDGALPLDVLELQVDGYIAATA